MNPDAATINAVVSGTCGDPFSILGMHTDGTGTPEVRVFHPQASSVAVVDRASGRSVATLRQLHPAGFFAGNVGRRKRRFSYYLEVETDGGRRTEEDPYAFPPVLSEEQTRHVAEGDDPRAYEYLGAHLRQIDGVEGVAFAVWAPNASRVSVVGHFNGWDGRRHVMRHRIECGAWEIFIPGIGPGELYKYEIRSSNGELLPLKADPYAFAAEHRPATASMVHDPGRHEWQDAAWLARREAHNGRDAPIAIYEVHLGSWRRKAEDGNRSLTYRELADELVPYVAWMGFTHIELMPVSEHPFDGSWGYQPTGLFAPTSRFGSPDEFCYFIDRCHQAGIGVLLDWVPGHFPSDPHGLANFDGTALYEHSDPRQGKHTDWDTLIYNYGRREVQGFLTSNATFWIERYHVDGLRVDAVASMLYLDYSRKAGEWIPNAFGGNENLEAIAFLKKMNEQVFGLNVGATTMAEESTAWPMVSRPTYLGGLGFGFKWNMGWMHDTLSYMSHEPIHRRYHHDNLTFGLIYAYNENFVLPLSHDEVVHGKGSLIGRMPGDRWRKFANLRAYYGFMYGHPGKKLLFMGGEFAQEREWNHDSSLDLQLCDDSAHGGVQRLIRDLNALYRQRPALFEVDFDPAGFRWIDNADVENSVLSFLRCNLRNEDHVLIVCNFTPVPRYGYRVGVPHGGTYDELLNTDAAEYGGSGVGNLGRIEATPEASHGQSHSVALTLPPLATLILAPSR